MWAPHNVGGGVSLPRCKCWYVRLHDFAILPKVYTLYNVRMYTIQCTYVHYTMFLCTLYNVRRTLYNVRRTLYNVHHALYNVYRTLYNVRMYTIQCTSYTIKCTSYTIQCTSYTIQCTSNIVHRTFVHLQCII